MPVLLKQNSVARSKFSKQTQDYAYDDSFAKKTLRRTPVNQQRKMKRLLSRSALMLTAASFLTLPLCNIGFRWEGRRVSQ